MHDPILAILDTETTGFSPKSGDKIVELAVRKYRGTHYTGESLLMQFWPQRSVPDNAARVHGLTTDMLRGKPLFKHKAEEIQDFLAGCEVWAHNAAFDQRFMDAEFDYAGLKFGHKINCSFKLAKKVKPQGPHKLENLAAWAGWTWVNRAHSAMGDTEALAFVLTQKLLPMAASPKGQDEQREVVQKPEKVQSRPTKSQKFTIEPWLGAKAPSSDPRLQAPTILPPLFAQGNKWEETEDLILRDRFLQGYNLAELVRDHGRSPAALALRLEKHGLISDNHPYARSK